MYRILYFEFCQETNSFNPVNGTLKDFANWRCDEGDAVFAIDGTIPCETNGMRDALKQVDAQLIPCVAMWSQSGGPVDIAVIDGMLDKLSHTYESAGKIDAVFGVLHGATQDTREADTCGYIVEQVRKMVGPEPVLAFAYDMHGNITDRILKNTDVCCGYQTYPHEDPYETAYRAATLGLKKLQDRSAFVTAAVTLPMLVPASGYTTQEGYFKSVLDLGHRYVSQGTLLDFTVFQLQPWLDAEPAGTTVLALAECRETAERCARELAQKLWDGRKLYWPELMSIDETIDRALANTTGKPVILANPGDSPNGGAVGDSVAALHRILQREVPLRFATLVRDADAVAQAFAVGVGNSAEFTFGAAISPTGQPPVRAVARVRSLHDGYYVQEGPINAGLSLCIGKAAVISVGTCDVLLCETPANTGDPQIFRHFGIEPKLYDLVEVKANTSFRLPYAAFSAEFCATDVPGCIGTAALRSLPFRKIPKNFYPFTEMDDYRIGSVVVY